MYKRQVWSFNNDYVSGIYLLNLPIEEWLFFLIIPFCCVFIYESTKYFYGSNGFLRLSNYRLTLITGAGLIFLAIIFYEKIYTRTYFSLAGILLILIYLYKPNWWGNFLTMFLFALIPFFIINGFLTGSFTEHPIVIYNDEQNLGIRILNIPLEDVFYCFNILVLVVALYEYQLSKVLSVK